MHAPRAVPRRRMTVRTLSREALGKVVDVFDESFVIRTNSGKLRLLRRELIVRANHGQLFIDVQNAESLSLYSVEFRSE